MAHRKKPQIDHVEDSSVADDKDLRTNLLDPGDFDRYVKMCFNGSVGSVKQLRDTSKQHLDRLGVKPDLAKATTKVPSEASDNVNLQSLYRWMEKLEKQHKKAVTQLKSLHATSTRRLGV